MQFGEQLLWHWTSQGRHQQEWIGCRFSSPSRLSWRRVAMLALSPLQLG